MATAAAPGPATPQRPLPGGFVSTPAPPGPTIFAANAASLRQTAQPPPPNGANPSTTSAQHMSPVERAAKNITDALAQEARFPDLESYITQGISGDYEIPKSPAWAPFEKVKEYHVPQRLLEQASHTGVQAQMGIFPPLSHAWLALDNCFYLWDYTLPNPDIIGWEENANPISTLGLVTPKSGVFIKEIEHLIVVVTNLEMVLLGVAAQTSPSGTKSIQLYNTRMSISIRGLAVDLIEHSIRTGRIFFTGTTTDDIYEFQYQQDEGWFRGRTNRVCHTRRGIGFVQDNARAVTQLWSSASPKKLIKSLVIDDTRGLLYSLSNTSEIQVWLLKDQLSLSLVKPMVSLLQNTGHFSPRTELLSGRDVTLVAVNAIPATESSKLSIVATTSTGCRLYISVTRGYGYQADAHNPPSSMQILHVRFPPTAPGAIPSLPKSNLSAATTFSNPAPNVDPRSRLLTPAFNAARFSPGYFMTFLQVSNSQDRVFCTAPDSARLKNPQDTNQLSQRFVEAGMWFEMPGTFSEVTAMTLGHFGATSGPLGFGNELAIQFDQPSAEMAFVGSEGITTIRRRRLVDIFAAVMKYGSSDDEGRDGDIKRFVRNYGRGEMAATALAVACGQGLDVSSDSRLTSVTDPEVLGGARRAFIEHGGKPEYNANALPDNSASQVDNVRPSPRYEGMALYISRLVRSIWTAAVIKDVVQPGTGPKLIPGVETDNLRRIQRDLTALSGFLSQNKSFIEGLSGPHALNRINSRQEEIALQGEHKVMHGLIQLTSSIVEGISFALVLFDERIEEIIAVLSDDSKSKARTFTFEELFVSSSGRELAKELVKAIVNRNIANGSNVDTVAEALRRRCGSFCSADDVVIFKAQEQVKKASEAGPQSESGRSLLNDSQRLFQKVASSLSMEHLHWATERYVEMSFFAGAIQLCLTVADEKDRAKRALAWLKDGMSETDDRKSSFDSRKRCYDLIFATITALDEQTGGFSPQETELPVAARKRSEAYEVVNSSEDAVFQTCLYDWYVSIGQADRLLDIDTQHVVDYLKRRSHEDKAHADLLWRYYAHNHNYLQAASVQLDLSRGYFDIGLEERIEYLSRARTNASTRQTVLTDSRQSKQQLLREISDLLDVANIQDDILQRMKSETRLTGDRRSEVLSRLNGPILSVDELFNQFTDQAGYYDISIQIFQVANHRNPADIKSTWQSLIDRTDEESLARYGKQALPWEAVGEKIRTLAHRLDINDATFPIHALLPMLEQYATLPRSASPPVNWALDLFLELDVPHETLLPVLERLYYGNERPFTGTKRRIIASQMVHLLDSWLRESERRGERVVFGSEENASIVLDCAASLLRGDDLDNVTRKQAEELNASVGRALR